MSEIDTWLDANRGRLFAELLDFIRAPSVSTDPAYAEGMRRAADLLRARLSRIGLDGVTLLEAGGHPAVHASWTGAPGAPTVLVYGHYDVQPPDPLDLWTTPPFEPAVRDGRLFARGASDDKSPLWIAVSAIEAWLAVHGRLPVNVKLLLEGEEEIGSVSLPAIMRAHRDLLAADVLLSADGGRPQVDQMAVSSRGLAGLEVTLRTAATDVHSGHWGGALGNAAMDLARLLATLHDAQNRIAVAGFMDDLRRPSNAQRAAIHALDFDAEAAYAAIGAKPGWTEPGTHVLEARWLRPTIEVNGLWGGYTGAGGKTVIPREAHAKITCRLGPGQDPARIAAVLEAHLRAHCPPWATLEFTSHNDGAAAYALPEDDPFLAAAERVVQDVHGVKPKRVGIGGTLPVSAMARQALGVECVMFAYGINSGNIHAPDEYFRVENFDTGLRAWTRVLAEMGRVSQR